MHRGYQPLTPANNIYLKKRWDQDYFETHRKKVSAAKSVIDNKPPKTYMHLHIKPKKLQMEGERLALVERDNRILLEKMAHMMRTGGRVHSTNSDYIQKSLNKTKRQRELLRITHENLAILKRITSKEPHYNHKKWLHDWTLNQQYMMNISKFAHLWRSDQISYEIRRLQQKAANKRIMEQVDLGIGPQSYYEARRLEKMKKPTNALMAEEGFVPDFVEPSDNDELKKIALEVTAGF